MRKKNRIAMDLIAKSSFHFTESFLGKEEDNNGMNFGLRTKVPSSIHKPATVRFEQITSSWALDFHLYEELDFRNPCQH